MAVSQIKPQGTAGSSPCFLLPGFYLVPIFDPQPHFSDFPVFTEKRCMTWTVTSGARTECAEPMPAAAMQNACVEVSRFVLWQVQSCQRSSKTRGKHANKPQTTRASIRFQFLTKFSEPCTRKPNLFYPTCPTFACSGIRTANGSSCSMYSLPQFIIARDCAALQNVLS